MMFHDIAYLEHWFRENEECYIIPYIEKNFPEESYNYQYWFMKKHLFFSKKIIEDDMMSNSQKQSKLMKQLSFGKSKIVLVVGGRGGGKTACAGWIVDELYKSERHNRIYFVKKGDPPKGFPVWINVVDELEDVPNNSIAILDESAIKYSSRNSMKDENKDFTSRLVILRHKDVSVIVITQNSKMVEINVRRLADIVLNKRGANLVHDDESPKDEKVFIRDRLQARNVEECFVEIPMTGVFMKFNHPLPEWWNDHISKSFSNFNPELETKLTKAQRIQREREIREEKFRHERELELAKLEKIKELGLATPKKRKVEPLEI